MQIRLMVPSDAGQVLEIYRQGIADGNATFETEAPSWEKFDAKFLKQCRLVSEENGEVLGWAVLIAVSARECYKGVGEVSIYIHEQHRRKGIGKKLLNAIVASSEEAGFWSLLSVIHLDNPISVHMHEQCGFRLIGTRERIAFLNGVWKTTVMMERRSDKVGI